MLSLFLDSQVHLQICQWPNIWVMIHQGLLSTSAWIQNGSQCPACSHWGETLPRMFLVYQTSLCNLSWDVSWIAAHILNWLKGDPNRAGSTGSGGVGGREHSASVHSGQGLPKKAEDIDLAVEDSGNRVKLWSQSEMQPKSPVHKEEWVGETQWRGKYGGHRFYCCAEWFMCRRRLEERSHFSHNLLKLYTHFIFPPFFRYVFGNVWHIFWM